MIDPTDIPSRRQRLAQAQQLNDAEIARNRASMEADYRRYVGALLVLFLICAGGVALNLWARFH